MGIVSNMVNTVTGGGVDKVKQSITEQIDAKVALNQMDPTYGAGQSVPNPAWDTWNQRKEAIQQRLAAIPNQPGYEGQRLAIEDDLRKHLAQEPPRETKTALGQDVQNVRDQGQQAVSNIQQGRDDIRTVGHEAFVQGQDVAAGLTQQGQAAQGRQGPGLTVAPGGRTEQQAAGAAAAGFNAATSSPDKIRVNAAVGGDRIVDAGNMGSANIARAGDVGSAGIAAAARTGVSALDRFAKGPAGPSAAEAMLRLRAAKDKAAALSRARSARGGPGAVAEAMKIAQAEGAAISSDTRGQAALVRANEAAANRAQQLQALSTGAALGLQGATSAGQLGLQGQTSAAEANIGATTAGSQLKVQGETAAGQLGLGESGQNLQAIQVRADIANSVRAMDIDEAKAQLGADLQTMQMNDEQTRFFVGLGEQARQEANNARANATQAGINADVAAAQVGLQYATQAWSMLTAEQQATITRMGIERGVIAQNQANSQAERQQSMQFLGTLLMAGASVASDRRAKRDVRRLRSMAAALRSTPGSTYRYKDKRDGKGQYTGPMAQDLEKTAEFRGAVVERGGKKTVDTGRLVMSHHAALSDLQRQIDRLEKLGRRKEARA